MRLMGTLLAALFLCMPSVAKEVFGRAADGVKTEVIRGGDEPVKLVIDVKDVKLLYLSASNGGDTYNSDQAVWCEPKLYRKDGRVTDLTGMTASSAKVGWGELQVRNVKVGTRIFKQSWYAHAPSVIKFDIAKLNAERLEVWVGIESASGKNGSSGFIVSIKEPEGLGVEAMTVVEVIPDQIEMPPVANVPIAQAKIHFNADAAKQLIAKGITQMLFVRRFTLACSHSYTEFIDSPWNPGGSLCLLDLPTGKVTELTPESMRNGVFNRCDLSWDAKKIIFDYKSDAKEPFCLYEMDIDGQNLKRLTFRVPEYDALMARYRLGPNDMHPCYLQDGSIMFSSSRSMVSVLCNGGDSFPATTLHRMDADGKNIRKVSFNTLSEFSPAVMPDGRVLYMRWEYNRKGAGEIKCLWSMRPDGSGTAEVYGNQIQDPETMLYGRPIPGTDKISFLGCSHWGPNNGVGTIIVLDTKVDPASTNAMRFITPDIMAMTHGGFTFLIKGKYVNDSTGRPGRLFKDPYPITENLFIASCKPKGIGWGIANGYHLVLVDAEGKDTLLFQDEGMSCWGAYPVMQRKIPPLLSYTRNEDLVKTKQAQCLVTDVYAGLDGVKRGDVKWLRVMEQTPRPWTARNVWGGGDSCGMAHTALGPRILGLHVTYGVVPVETDGSANFIVPAERNIYFQTLDADGRVIQTERTYVNYMPGEIRGCVGCHERGTGNSLQITSGSLQAAGRGTALKRKPSVIQAEPEAKQLGRVYDYERQIQPIWDAKCVSCHGGEKPAANMSLAGDRTDLFSLSYENLTKRNVTGKQANENAVRTGDTEHKNPYFYGAYSSILAAMFDTYTPCFDGFPGQADVMQKRLVVLRENHKKIILTSYEKRQIYGWLDTSCQYYPSYWGQKNIKHKDSPFFRPEVSIADAIAPTWPSRMDPLYKK
ncbi:MAG: NPCBM/NEW2 domain-containing protein [bacterium]